MQLLISQWKCHQQFIFNSDKFHRQRGKVADGALNQLTMIEEIIEAMKRSIGSQVILQGFLEYFKRRTFY